jgi:hypothetical protein
MAPMGLLKSAVQNLPRFHLTGSSRPKAEIRLVNLVARKPTLDGKIELKLTYATGRYVKWSSVTSPGSVIHSIAPRALFIRIA